MAGKLTVRTPDIELEAIRRSTDLYALEGIIQRGKRTFLEVGVALCTIRKGELYKSTHSSWEGYCQQRWGWTGRRGNQLVLAADVTLGLDGTRVPTDERQARELARLPSTERDEALAEAEELGGGEVSARVLRTVVNRRLGKEAPPSVQERRTPQWLFDFLNRTFGPFTLDVFADEKNALCDTFYTEQESGLEHPWHPRTFANPPFRLMGEVMAKALSEAGGVSGSVSCIVGPVGCSQEWFHNVARYFTVFAPDARINFDDESGRATGGRGFESGADRDTMIYLIGPGWENERPARFRVQPLRLKEVRDENRPV